MPVPTLTSPRLILRAPRRQDASAIAALANDFEVARRLARLPHPYSLQDAVVFLEEIVPKERIWVVESSGALAGVIGLTPDNDALELGYWIGRPFWGRGLATHAAGLVLDYAFDRAVTAGCFTDNFRSLRVLHKLGFVITGQSLRLCMAEQRELPHYDLVLTRP